MHGFKSNNVNRFVLPLELRVEFGNRAGLPLSAVRRKIFARFKSYNVNRYAYVLLKGCQRRTETTYFLIDLPIYQNP